MRRISDYHSDFAGLPVPLGDMPLILEPRHPFRADWRKVEAILQEPYDGPEVRITCGSETMDWYPNNEWYCGRRDVWVTLEKNIETGQVRVSTRVRRAGDRITMWVQTVGACRAWDVEAEREAMAKLRTLVAPHIADQYELTGSFIEHSPRSKVTYLFRRCRPTVALVPFRRWPDENDSPMKILSVLCLHPIGLYARSWAGAMVPTDDVVAHLLLMRGDEHMFWRKANHHNSQEPEAGI